MSGEVVVALDDYRDAPPAAVYIARLAHALDEANASGARAYRALAAAESGSSRGQARTESNDEH
jgi:hypothetical protein